MKEKLCLCYFGDGPLWDNTVLVPAYPSGFSYPRPFRYRKKWVENELLEEMTKQTNYKGEEAILCMRFISDTFSNKIIPIRKILIHHIEFLTEPYSVYFTTEAMYSFDTIDNLSEACIELDELSNKKTGGALFFRLSINPPLVECRDQDSQVRAWTSLSDILANETLFPINENAKKAIFLHFVPFINKKPAPILEIHKSFSAGSVYGMDLIEGKSYEMIFYHRIPHLISHNTSISNSSIHIKARAENLELSRPKEDFSANYDRHVIDATAVDPTAAWEEIILEPEATTKTQAGDPLNSISVRIPFKVSISHLYRIRRTYIWLFMIWASLFCNTIVSYRINEKKDWTLIVITAVVAVFSAFGVFMLQNKKK